MDYNEHLVRRIERFEDSVKRRRLPGEAAQKLLSILGCLEYQIEQGECPASVIRALQAAMRSWIGAAGDQTGLVRELDECVDGILEDMAPEASDGSGRGGAD